jgi:hypothetical protein
MGGSAAGRTQPKSSVVAEALPVQVDAVQPAWPLFAHVLPGQSASLPHSQFSAGVVQVVWPPFEQP